MAQPPAYTRQYNATQFSTQYPSTPHPGVSLDAEFNAVKTTLDAVRTNIALIQRDDGAVANNSIGLNQLAPELALGVHAPTDWVTGTAYSRHDIVWQSNALYICNTAHTSGVFATDLAASKWTAFLDYSSPLTAANTAAAAAAASQAAAALSATNAASSATAAATSATAAAASATLAASYYNSISFPIGLTQGGTGATTASGARTNLGLVIGTNVQAYAANLTTYAGITPSANVQSLLGAADYAAMRSQLGLVIGTNVQAYDADLTTWAGITPSANVQTFVSAANFAAMRSALGSTTVGDAVFIAANAAAALSALTAGGVGSTNTWAAKQTFNADIDLATGADNYLYYDGNLHVAQNGVGDAITIAVTTRVATFAARPVFNGNTPYDSGNLAGTALNWTAAQDFANTISVPNADTSIKNRSSSGWIGIVGHSSGFGTADAGAIIVRSSGGVEHYSGSTRILYSDPSVSEFENTDLRIKLAPASLATNSAGFRGAPQNSQGGDYTFVLSDAGMHVYHNSAGTHAWTIPPNSSVAFPIGTIITLYVPAGTVTVTRGAGVSLFKGDGTGVTDGNRTISTVGVASILKVNTDTWVIMGSYT